MDNLIIQKSMTEQESNYLFDLDYQKRGYEVLLGYLARANNMEVYEEEKKTYLDICQEYHLFFNKLISKYFLDELMDISQYNFYVNFWDNIIFLKPLDRGNLLCPTK